MKQAIRVAFLMSAAGVLTGCPNRSGRPVGGVGNKLELKNDKEVLAVVAIEQDGKHVMLHDNEARLARKPFTVIVALPKWDGVMVNASHTDRLAAPVRAGTPVSTVLPLPRQGMPEDLGNPRKSVFVTDDDYNYWYYFGDASNRFDDVIHAQRVYVCKRHIVNLAGDKDGPLTPLTQLAPQTKLYLTFVATGWSGGRRVQKAVQYVKLVFE